MKLNLEVGEQKQGEHAQLSDAVARFLAEGGKIQRFAPGECSGKDLSQFSSSSQRKSKNDVARLNRKQRELAIKREKEAGRELL